MTEKKRTKFEYNRDLVEIAKLYLDGYTQMEIAEKLPEITGAKYTLSRRQISYDIQKLVGHWKKSHLKTINEKIISELQYLNREIQRLNEIEKIARESFELSKTKSVKKTKEKRLLNDESDNKIAKISTTQYERYGNADFLKIMIQCNIERVNISKERRKLLGLDAAIKLNIGSDNLSSAKFSNLSNEELEAKYLELKELIELHESEGYGEYTDFTEVKE